MTHTSTEQPEALRVAAWLITAPQNTTMGDMLIAGRELRRLHARILELEEAQAGRVALSDEQIEALPVWDNFVGLFPSTRLEIARAIIKATHGITQEKQG